MNKATSFLEPEGSNAPRIVTLLPGVRVTEVADACRSAALGFAWGAHHGWGRRELARWLVGPYARAAAATRSLRVSGMRPAVIVRPLTEDTIEELLRRARAEVIEVLRGVWSWTHDGATVRARIDEGLVAGIVDDASNLGFAPVDQPRMRLVDRVRSLFIADYLTRPTEYAAFVVCPECDGATFDGGLYHVDCMRPRRTVLRRRAVRDVALPGETELALPDFGVAEI
ncbi:MAG: hypothetical protein JWP87_5647 [Labilithrix sp.]|nr:hypothetical protein [Labilithrix sp.]